MTLARLAFVLRKRGMNLMDAEKLGCIEEGLYWTKTFGGFGDGLSDVDVDLLTRLACFAYLGIQNGKVCLFRLGRGAGRSYKSP